MRHILIIILTLFLSSCSTKSFDKDYYERTTGIKFPNNYKVLQTFDNGEFITGTVFQIDSVVLRDFILNNLFDTLKDKQYFTLQSATFFEKQLHPDILSNHKFFVIRKAKDKNRWTYLADMTTHKLWAEISYPDWGGQ